MANSTIHLRWMHYYNSGIFNYDFRDPNYTSTNVDWPVRFLFRGNYATVSFVQERLDGCSQTNPPYMSSQWCDVGGPMWEFGDYYDPGNNYHAYWSSNQGIKNAPWCSWNDGHLRAYADSGYRDYNWYWGYYVIASVHEDKEGTLCPFTEYRSTETTEARVVSRVSTYLSGSPYFWSTGYVDDLQNYESGWAESDGWARLVNVGN